uniref:Adenosine kinase n=1 Tax=Lygus hesperus TaxID=30085 RepID=A0A0A9XZP9_LYGHE
MSAVQENGVLFTDLRRRFETLKHNGRSNIDHLKVSNILRDFIYFDFWAFFLLLTPMYAFKAMRYVAEKGLIYVAPFVLAFGMIYHKSLIHVKDWVLRKWMYYKDF